MSSQYSYNGGSRRLSSPVAYKHLVHLMESEFKPNRIEKDLEKMVGKKMPDRRWQSIKLKYNMKNHRESCASTDTILKNNMKQRLKIETKNYEHKRLTT